VWPRDLGISKKYADVCFKTVTDALVGHLDYRGLSVATATMGYKHHEADARLVAKSLAAPNFLLKIIPHVDCTPRICELVEFHLEDINVHWAYSGPCGLDLRHHALAPVADLPILEIISAVHFKADLTLGMGKVVHDYLAR
jgi:acetoacetate decarboxylase